jgi:hypothetical protein
MVTASILWATVLLFPCYRGSADIDHPPLDDRPRHQSFSSTLYALILDGCSHSGRRLGAVNPRCRSATEDTKKAKSKKQKKKKKKPRGKK